jgi:phosphoglycerate dehydrogenase-like enzyme
VFRDTVHDLDELAARLAPFEIVCTNRERTPFPAALIERLPNLRLLCTTGMHNHAIDTNFARERGIFVAGTQSDPDSTAELTWGMIFALMRNICAEDASMRAGGWQATVGHGLTGKVLGVLGLARIGAQVARVGKAIDMRVVAWSSNLTQERCREVGVELVDKDTLFSVSDVLTIHIRLSERTRHLVGAADLARMKPAAYLVNTSRGPIIDESALVQALQSNTIAGAALDVYDVEPLPADHVLRGLPNTLLLPHIGYVTDGMYRNYWPQTVENVAAYLDGKPIRPIRIL